MATPTIKSQLLDVLDQLLPHQQAQLLEMAQRLQRTAKPQGTSGHNLLAYSEQLALSDEEARAMQNAIEDAFGKVNPDDWA
jgi:hypothetical protein